MNRPILFIAFLFVSLTAFAQVDCSDDSGLIHCGVTGTIADDGTETCFPLNVPILWPAQIDTLFGLLDVGVNLTHHQTSQLDIELVTPSMNRVLLSEGNGAGANMNYTVFTQNALSGIDNAANTNPYNGSYFPDENLGNANNGQLAVGLWQVCITDNVAGDNPGDAELLDWWVKFGDNPAPPFIPILPVCNTNVTVGCACPDGGTNCFLLPDIVIPYSVVSDPNRYTEEVGTLRVTTATSNIGYGALEFRGSGQWFCGEEPAEILDICDDGSPAQQLVYQRVYKRLDGFTVDHQDFPAGTMFHHAELGHDHPHIDQWAQNTLRIKGLSEDPREWPVVGEGVKISFCAENTLACTEANGFCESDSVNIDIVDLPNAYHGGPYACNADIQGVSVGYSDVYNQTLAGQEIIFSYNQCNGKYYVVSEFDPDSIFWESNENNNVTIWEVELQLQQNCCVTDFQWSQVDAPGSVVQFLDRSQAIPETWVWDFGDGNFSSEQFPLHTYDAPGTYNVTLSTNTSFGCNNFRMMTVEVDSMIVDIAAYNILEGVEMKVGPNPFSGSSAVQFELVEQGAYAFDLYDMSGRKVQSIASIKNYASGMHRIEFDLAETGVFMLVMTDGKASASQRVLSF